jgi:hypothetical protein
MARPRFAEFSGISVTSRQPGSGTEAGLARMRAHVHYSNVAHPSPEFSTIRQTGLEQTRILTVLIWLHMRRQFGSAHVEGDRAGRGAEVGADRGREGDGAGQHRGTARGGQVRPCRWCRRHWSRRDWVVPGTIDDHAVRDGTVIAVEGARVGGTPVTVGVILCDKGPRPGGR